MEPRGILWFIGVFGGMLLNSGAVVAIIMFIKSRHVRIKAPSFYKKLDDKLEAYYNSTSDVNDRTLGIFKTIMDTAIKERDLDIKERDAEIKKLSFRVSEIISQNESLKSENETLKSQNNALKLKLKLQDIS